MSSSILLPLVMQAQERRIGDCESACRLQARKQNEWRDKVELVYGDMRMIQVPEPGDIIVSELLGSFGDNELSPECLDGAMRFLKRSSPLTLLSAISPSVRTLTFLVSFSS